jgi:hypothetical protein
MAAACSLQGVFVKIARVGFNISSAMIPMVLALSLLEACLDLGASRILPAAGAFLRGYNCPWRLRPLAPSRAGCERRAALHPAKPSIYAWLDTAREPRYYCSIQ